MNIQQNLQKMAFTLVELLVAMVIAIISFTGVYAMSKQSVNYVRASQNELMVTQALQYEIETLRTHDWIELLALGTGYVVTASENFALEKLKNGEIEVLITPYPGTSQANPVRAVSATVNFTTPGGINESRSFTTLIAEWGM